jgi:uncharacterized membrane protein YgcG
MRSLQLLVVVLFVSVFAKAQHVNGKLLDLVDNKPLAGASIRLQGLKDSSRIFNGISDSSGRFTFGNVPADSFSLQVSYIGYENYKQFVVVSDSVPSVDMGTLYIPKKSTEIGGVTVTAKTPPAQQKGDTTQYNASQFKVNPDATVEDLVKKMPGITVDKDGTVTAQGEQVRKVTIDGRDFFGDDASAALRNLPSEVVDKIQVFDRLSDQAQFTGVDDGNAQKAINIVTKSGMRNGQFGRLYVGVGTDNRYQGGGNVSFFKNNRRISFVGLFNNINQQNFGSQDLLGLTSGSSGGNNRGGGGNRGGRGGGGNFGGGGTNNFLVGQQSGISKTNAIGVNYSDKWGTKVDVSGSYFFNNSNTDNNSITGTQSFVKADSTLFLDDTATSQTSNYNHRVNFRMEYKIDSNNTLIISPNISFQKNDAESNTTSSSYYDLLNGLQSESVRRTNSLNSGYNFNNNILYRHAFAKRGRTISFNLGTSVNNKTGESYIESVNKYYNSNNVNDSVNQFSDSKTKGRTISANIVYTEPVGKKGQLQFNYNPSFTNNSADKVTYQYDETGGKYSVFDTTLSNKFENTYNTQSAGVTYRIGDRDNQFSAGLNYQYSSLQSEQEFPAVATIDRTFSNILPNLQFRRKLSARSNIRLFYRASVNAPSVNQLQNVIDNSNQLRMSTGNPALDQQYTHFVSARYIFTNTQKGQSFFANVFVQKANDYVANATYTAAADSVLAPGITLYKGSQLTKPINLDGYWSFRSFLTFGQPVKFIKSNINLNAGFSYSKLPGLVNNVSTFSNTYTYSGGIVVASNISEYIDFNVSYNTNYNVVKNTVQPELNQNYVAQSAGLQVNLLSKKGWFVQNDISNQSYSGLSEGFNQSFWLWNAGIGKKFLKNRQGELKLTVFDLLKQNQSITRNVGDSYIEDVQNLVLKQYFMLTFTYSLKNFGKGRAPASDNRENRREMGGMPRF